MGRSRCWTYAAGEKGHTVTVYEREPGGLLYARALDPSLQDGRGGYRRVSLGHRDRERAKTYALDQAAKLREGRADVTAGANTLARLFALYLAKRTPRKSAGEQGEDRRRVGMWTRVLGARKDPHMISLGEWEALIDVRQSGAIAPDGTPVPEGKREPVRLRTVGADCQWLRWVLNWGTEWRDETCHYVLRENAVRGYPIPTEKNPRRPVATADRYDALRAVSDQVLMETRWGGQRARCRSYLSELLDIVQGSGRRISAVCALQYQDLRLDKTKGAPHGAIRWPGETDKMGKEWVAPISGRVRAALDRVLKERPAVGAAYLFPSPTDRSEPVRYELTRDWLVEAERLAKLRKQQGSLWHAFRRGWATARKHLPDVDVAAAGGWKSTETLRRCYQQPDPETMLAVVLGGAELREKQA